jgi:hypothetical protein
MLSLLTTLLLLAPPLLPQGVGGESTLLQRWDGPPSAAAFTVAVSGVGDLNSDGFDDIAVAAPRASLGGISLSGSVFVYSGATGTLLYQWNGSHYGGLFGAAISGGGDINADGIPDVIIGAPSTNTGGVSHSGSVFAYSGADGSLLFRWDGVTIGEGLGGAVDCASDLNGDGHADILVGADSAEIGGMPLTGHVTAFSGADGSVLYRWEGEAVRDEFGTAVAGLGDINGDAIDDVLITARAADSNGLEGTGAAYAFSGADGSLIFRWNHPVEFDRWGTAAAAAGDVNGDGTPDILLGAYLASDEFLMSGAACVLSGVDGSVLHLWHGESGGNWFGYSVAGTGDINEDGFADVLIGANSANPGGLFWAGSTYLYSGFDGSLMQRWDGEAAWESSGNAVGNAGDVNGDGRPDILTSAAATSQGGGTGSAYVYSFDPFLFSDVTSVSASAGGVINLQLNLPSTAALFGYRVLMSATGYGVMTDHGAPIPLAQDFLVDDSYYGVYPFSSFSGLHGVLDANGDALASVNFAPLEISPTMVGRTIWIAAAASQNGVKPAELSSIALPITIAP